MKKIQAIEVLKNTIIITKAYYLQHRRIFGSENKNEFQEYVLIETGAGFFSMLTQLFWNTMVLSISGLAETYESGTNTNLSLGFLVAISNEENRSCAVDMATDFAELQKVTKSIRNYRRKVVAHFDYKSFDKRLSVHIQEIENAIAIMEKMMNRYFLEVGNYSYGFDANPNKDSASILYYLRQGLIYKKMKDDRGQPQLDHQEEFSWEQWAPTIPGFPKSRRSAN